MNADIEKDDYQEASDLELLEEHATHPERFHRVSPDMDKVRKAVERYAPTRVVTTFNPHQKGPVDAALRNPILGHGVVCRAGFYHPHFLNGLRNG